MTFLVELTATVIAGMTTSDNNAVGDVMFMAMFITLAVGIPVACGVAILKYRLYDLDLVIRKTVVVGAMALFITLIYALIVGLGSQLFDSSALSFVAAAVLALGFQPARDRARKLADRLVYGERATPYEVLADFSGRMGEAYAVGRRAPAHGAGPCGRDGGGACGRLAPGRRRDGGVRRVPPRCDRPDELPDDAVEVLHQGERLGALSVTMPPPTRWIPPGTNWWRISRRRRASCCATFG